MNEKKLNNAQGYSLHIGLNLVDSNSYSGWTGVLKGCVNDASAMRHIAISQKYVQAKLLLNEEATRKNVISQIEELASLANAGDLVLISYSGHGGQIPDLNGDEKDLLDETWCLFDGQLIDDELQLLWSKFATGVRVFVVSDSCHSGTVTREIDHGNVTTNSELIKHIPTSLSMQIFNEKKREYVEFKSAIGTREKGIGNPTVRLLSACHENQTAFDGPVNGLFTAHLLAIWDDGNFNGNHDKFVNSILHRMPSSQTPQHRLSGPEMPEWSALPPFVISTTSPHLIKTETAGENLYYDIHCHLFNRTFLARELFGILIREIKQLLLGQHPKETPTDRGIIDGIGKTLAQIGHFIETLRRINTFLKIGLMPSSTAIYNHLNSVYKNQFIVSPLMFDLKWCFVENACDDANRSARMDEPAMLFHQAKRELFHQAKQFSAELKSTKENTFKSSEADSMNKALTREVTLFNKLIAELELHDADLENKRGLGDNIGLTDGFSEQISQLVDLRSLPGNRNTILPFLAVDPRRSGILQLAKELVGEGKPFVGIKLYTPNGYSPTDPLLYGDDNGSECLYAFCQENQIPITAHNSFGGFATFMNKVEITGDIFIENKIVSVEHEMIEFNTSLLSNGLDAIKERATKLNHPLLWEKVLEKFSNLKLNLAHFGGDEELGKALSAPDKSDLWSNHLIRLLNCYPHVYTDLSCTSDFEVLHKLIASPIYHGIRHKILYGSDYYLLILFDRKFNQNVKQFHEIFAMHFDLIAHQNPKKFLFNS